MGGTGEQEVENARASLELKKSENRHREKEVERIVDHESRIKEVRVSITLLSWIRT